MTGIQLDLLTVILLLVLTFICGFSAGHRIGRDEVKNFVTSMIDGLQKSTATLMDQQKQEAERKRGELDSFLKMLSRTNNKGDDEAHE